MIKTLADVHGDNRRVVAKCCGRITNADMVAVLLPLSDTAKARLSIKALEICDACRERLLRDKRCTHSQLRELFAKKGPVGPSVGEN